MINHFVVYRNSNCTDRSDRHQQALVKWLAVPDSFKCLDQNIIANHQIRDQIEDKPQQST